MIAKSSTRVLILLCAFLFSHYSNSQEKISKTEQKQEANDKLKFIDFYTLRGTNVLEAGIGSSVINGDFEDPLFEIYFRAGYKRYLTPHLNIGLSYHKFNLAYEDLFNNGFMSFDFNVEYLLLPHKKISPFIYGGMGYVASNYFEETTAKVQAGGGVEFIISDGLGVTLFTDYNYAFDDRLDGFEAGSSDDTFFRMGLGMQFYFGGSKKKERIYGDEKTVINSNLLVPSKTTKVTK